MKNEVKTKVTDASVSKFIDSIADEAKRNDCRLVLEMMRKKRAKQNRKCGAAALLVSIVTITSVRAVVKAIGP